MMSKRVITIFTCALATLAAVATTIASVVISKGSTLAYIALTIASLGAVGVWIAFIFELRNSKKEKDKQ